MAKVAFVSIMWHSRFVEELGVEYLTAVLRKETNHEVRIFYKFPEDNYNDFFQQVIGFNPDIVGISLSHKYTGLEPLYAGASLLKEKLPEVYLCIGGIFASTNAENIMRKIQEVDCVFLGESENIIVDFVDKVINHQSIDALDGVVYRCENGTLKTIPKKNFIMDLDAMPLTEGKKRLATFANEILKRGLRILWTCCFRAETFKNNKEDIELIELMVKSGLYNLLIGVEAGNKRALNNFSKRATISDNYQSIEIFDRYPVYISKGFIMFTPQSTPSLLRDNLEFAHKIGLDQELIYLTTKAAVFDQTPYVTDLQNEGYLTQDYDWENEYPYTWKDDNVRQFAEALQFIRDVYMDELEYTQYYGRNAIIWYRFAEGRYRKELEYNQYHVNRLRKEIGIYNYAFISASIDLCERGWNIHEYRIIKSKYFDHGFLKVYDEMVLQSKKISRLFRMNNITMEDIANNH